MPDFADHGAPLGADFLAGAPTGELSADQIASFAECGYVEPVQILNSRQVAQLREELDRLTDPSHPRRHLFHEYHSDESADPNTRLFHALGAWRVEPGFHDLLWSPAFVTAARQLLKGPIRFWHDQLFCKPARDGGVVAWHQDYSYWTRTRPMAHLTCWIALDDSTVANGCLHYVPGSHRWDLLPITGLAGDMHAIESVLDEERRAAFKPVPIELPAGWASFHHPLLVHGSYANESDRPRRGAVINVVRDGVRSASDEALLAGVDVIPTGKELSGRFFPRL